jgi:hypothetical protein
MAKYLGNGDDVECDDVECSDITSLNDDDRSDRARETGISK